MSTIELLKHAISNKLTIEYEYVKGGTAKGNRIGNPHLIFNGGRSVMIYKTGGVSTIKNPKNNWNRYDTKLIKIVNITDKQFEIAHGFNLDDKKGEPLFKDIVFKVS